MNVIWNTLPILLCAAKGSLHEFFPWIKWRQSPFSQFTITEQIWLPSARASGKTTYCSTCIMGNILSRLFCPTFTLFFSIWGGRRGRRGRPKRDQANLKSWGSETISSLMSWGGTARVKRKYCSLTFSPLKPTYSLAQLHTSIIW